MRSGRIACLVLLAATAVLAFGASTASPGTKAQETLRATAASPVKVSVRYTIKKFVRQGNRLVAQGTAIASYAAPSGAVKTSRQPFTAKVAVRGRRLAKGNALPTAAQRICPILDLTLAPLDLNLLGLMIHLDRVHLTITADSNGGLLGSLLCGLTQSGRLSAQTVQLNWAMQQSGLATNGIGVVVTLQPAVAAGAGGGNATPNALTPNVICDVLALTLGPLDLNLLGLIVHLDRVRLVITADSEGGLLGSLLCSLAGGAPA
jgi:hypothetical protein